MPVGKMNLLHEAFITGVVLKGVDAVLQILCGVSLFLISPQSLNRWVLSLIGHDLSEGYLAHWALGWSAASHHFAAFYLFSHGAVKLFIVAVLLKGKIWAYHTGILVFLIFIVYQIYRYSYTRSPWLIVLSVLDVAVICLTWEEYKRVKRIRAASRRGRD